MKLAIKPGPSGARVAGLRPEALLALVVAGGVYAAHGDKCVLTSALDSRHSPGSLHYAGLAVDLRLPSADRKAAIVRDLKEALGDDYDVVEKADHIHIEFQPKRAMNQ